MRILFIRPIVTERPDSIEEKILSRFASRGTKIKALHLQQGPASIECEADLARSEPFVLEIIEQVKKEKYGGIVSYCFVNPGVKAGKKLTNKPLIGSGEAAISLALCLGKKIGIITVAKELVPIINKQNAALVSAGMINCIRSIDVPVLNLYEDKNLLDKLFEESHKAVIDDGADVLVLGCTGILEVADKLHQKLEAADMDVPVVDPAAASVKVMEAIIGSNLSHARLSKGRESYETR
jgi:allantoin racemase